MMFFNFSKKILVIDDDRTILRQIQAHFSQHKGVTIFTAENGQAGLTLASRKAFDLIILDWTLPDIAGIDILSLLRRKSSTKNTPVLMLTGRSKIGEIERAFGRGANGYITKPFSLKKLRQKALIMIN